MKHFKIIRLGCSRRGIDGARIRDYLLANGLSEADDPAAADIMIVVSCGLTEADTSRVKECVKDLQQYRGEVMVYGCLPAMDPEALDGVFAGHIIITKEIDKLDDYFQLPVKFSEIPDANTAFAHLDDIIVRRQVEQPVTFPGTGLLKLARKVKWKTKRRLLNLKFDIKSLLEKKFIENIPNGIGFDNSLFSIRVTTGCAGNCTFCVIKKAIGDLKSKPLDEISAEAERAVSGEKQRINILSSDAGAYGIDIGSSFPEMLGKILDVDKRLKIAFVQDVNPVWLCRYSDEMAEHVKTKRILSILSPVQSGSKRVLRLMKRYHETGKIINTFNQLKKAWPGLRIRTQVIVGFPTETDEEFDETIEMVKRCRFDEIDIFEYYEVKGSQAANLYPKVPPEVIKKRMEKIKSSVKIPYRSVGSSKFKKYFRWYTKYY